MDRTSEHFPGGVLKDITEEYEHLQQFIAFVRRRVELDRKYFEDIQRLNQSVNPKWSQLPIGLLVGPLIDYFTSEILERQEMCGIVESCINELDVGTPPDRLENNESMNDQYQELIKAFNINEARRVDAHTSGSFRRSTRSGEFPKYQTPLYELDEKSIRYFSPPVADREYRQAVLYQQKISTEVSKWHRHVLPGQVEAHQDRSENIKGVIQKICTQYSALYLKLITRLGHTTNHVDQFSSVGFVGRAHEYRRLEAEHTYMKPVAYIDIETGEARSTIVFGTEMEKEVMKKAADAILERRGLSHTVSLVPSIQHIYELERQFRRGVSLDDTLKTFTDEELGTLLCFIILTSPPLIPLRDGEALRFGARGLPRDGVEIMMNRLSNESREFALKLLYLLRGDGYGEAAFVLLTGCPHSSIQRMMGDILRKWDFKDNCILPKGVRRQYDEERSWPYRERNAEGYIPQARRNSRLESPI